MSETTPGPQPQDIGSILALARQKRKQSRDDVARALRMPERLIASIEENRPEDFPAPVYYRGSVQNYCEHLDVDFEALWRRTNPPPAEQPAAAPRLKAPERDSMLPKLAPSVIIPSVLLGVLLLAAGIFWFATRQAPPPAPKAAAEPPKLLRPLSSKKGEAARAAVAVSTPTAKERAGAGHRLEITPIEEAWVRLRVDKKLVFEGELPAGRTADWEGDSSFAIRTPSTQLRISLDGKELHLDDLARDTYGNILIPAAPPETSDASDSSQE